VASSFSCSVPVCNYFLFFCALFKLGFFSPCGCPFISSYHFPRARSARAPPFGSLIDLPRFLGSPAGASSHEPPPPPGVFFSFPLIFPGFACACFLIANANLSPPDLTPLLTGTTELRPIRGLLFLALLPTLAGHILLLYGFVARSRKPPGLRLKPQNFSPFPAPGAFRCPAPVLLVTPLARSSPPACPQLPPAHLSASLAHSGSAAPPASCTSGAARASPSLPSSPRSRSPAWRLPFAFCPHLSVRSPFLPRSSGLPFPPALPSFFCLFFPFAVHPLLSPSPNVPRPHLKALRRSCRIPWPIGRLATSPAGNPDGALPPSPSPAAPGSCPPMRFFRPGPSVCTAGNRCYSHPFGCKHPRPRLPVWYCRTILPPLFFPYAATLQTGQCSRPLNKTSCRRP